VFTLMRATRLRLGFITAAVAGLALSSVVLSTTAASAASGIRLPSSGVESPPSGTLTETGSTLLYPLFNLWVSGYTEKYPSVTINTAGTGSGTGISDADNGTVDIGASDAYLSPSTATASPHLKNIPLAISAQLIAYNLPGVEEHLKLDGKVLSEIYQGQITRWNASPIATLNPGVTLPNMAITTLHRSDSSGDTFLFTQFLSKTDPDGWGAKISYNTTVPWPAVTGALGEDGNSGMVSGCKATPGCIAYIGISYLTQMLQAGLGYAELQNAKGQYELPTSSSIEAEANAFTKKTPANGTISMIYGPAEGGYPIINYEYAIVSSVQSSSSTAKGIRSVLEWAVNPKYGGSSQYLDQVNFQPLPKKVEAQSITQILKITS
jgi:phosphate transport system substrate-binding protein